VLCAPTGGRGSGSQFDATAVFSSDPSVEEGGIDTGYSPNGRTLRAPDIAVGNVPRTPGWVPGVPPLAVEYADTGQDEEDLQVKIRELLGAGTKFIWVVRLVGPRRVEVYTPGNPMRLSLPGALLEAPGILTNAVPVNALYDRDAALEVTLRNLVQRKGYASFDAALESSRKEGLQEGKAEGQIAAKVEALRKVLVSRGWQLTPEMNAQVDACRDLQQLNRWFDRALAVTSLALVWD
jgi:hypothetical protein